MKNATFLKIVSLFIFLLSAQSSFGQEQLLHSENFTGQLNVGAQGPGSSSTVIDPSTAGVDWTIDVSSTSLTSYTHHFKVVNTNSASERMTASDLDGDAFWYSPSINITNYSDVRFLHKVVGEGASHLSSNDYVKTHYRINGGTWTQAETNGNLAGNFGTQYPSQTGLSGSTLEIRVTMNNQEYWEVLSMDNLEVYGTSNPTAAFSASANAVDTTQTITFTNNSTNATSYSWNFGDSTTSSATSPSHPYASPGTYTVTLTATGSSGSDTATTTITVYAVTLLNLPQSHDFNSGQESWISGGSKAQLLDVTQLENQGWNTNGTNFIDYNNNSCDNLTGNVFVLRGSDSTDRILQSPSYAMSGYDSVIFDYDYFVQSMDNSSEGWNLDYSNDSGNTWTTVKSYRKDTDFDNLDCGPNDYGNKEVVILDDATYSFTDQSKFRMYTERDGGNVGSWDYLVIDNVTITGIITSTCSASGTILMERYDGISGTAISDLTGSANYPENPSSDAQLTSFEIPTDVAENYGAKVSGYICAPETGYYTFWIASDDNGQLNLSTDDDPANKTTIATVASWTSSRQWDKYTTQKSDRILLIMGESYYVEALMKENGGGDNLAVGWAKPGESTNAPSQVIPGSVLSPAVSNYFGTDILFSEDQADASQSDSTISGTGTSVTNASGIAWTMNRPNSKVKTHIDSNPHIHCEKLNGDTVTWVTEDIIISGYTNLNFTVFARKIQSYGSNDYIKLQYSIDGGTTRINIATYNTNLTNTSIGGDINTLTSTTVVGDTLKIYIEVYNDGNNEKFEWEDITLTGTPFYNVWQGIESDLVTNTAKWSKGSQPTAASNVWIPNTKHLKLTDDQAYNTVNARATSQLTIEKTGSLTTVGDFTKIAGTGTVTLNSDATEFASIIVGGTATGNITYNRWVNKTGPFEGNNWDFVGSPLKNQRIDNFVSANSGVLPNSGDIYGIAKYFNEWDSWEWYTDSNIGDDIFNTGESYYTSTIVTGNASGATLAFTGEIPTGTQTKEIINNNGTNTIGRRWEMVANPYASYIHGNPASGDAVNNFVKVNLDLNLLEPSFGAIYAWDGTGGYTIYNLSQINTATIAPGQGFWIAARQSTPQQLQFTPAMQTVEGGDDFISGAPILLNYMLNLKLYHGTTEKAKTSFYFQQGLTDGLDTGYDAGALEQTQAISSRLTENDQGYNMSINAMSIETVYNQSIPLVINQQEGQPFRVSISENTIPEEVNVYLEDVLNGTLTSLKDQDFELSAQSDLSEDGRFYIRFTTQSLAIYDVLNLSNLNVYKINKNSFITIKGLTPDMGKTTATLYNMLGMKVREKALDSSQSAQRISTQGLASGVYIINLKAGDQAVSKKIIIQ